MTTDRAKMATPTRPGWEITKGRLIAGIIYGAFILAVAYGARYALGLLQTLA